MLGRIADRMSSPDAHRRVGDTPSSAGRKRDHVETPTNEHVEFTARGLPRSAANTPELCAVRSE